MVVGERCGRFVALLITMCADRVGVDTEGGCSIDGLDAPSSPLPNGILVRSPPIHPIVCCCGQCSHEVQCINSLALCWLRVDAIKRRCFDLIILSARLPMGCSDRLCTTRCRLQLQISNFLEVLIFWFNSQVKSCNSAIPSAIELKCCFWWLD